MSNLDGTAAEEGDGETSRGTDSLLASSDETIKFPVVKGELLYGDTAHTVGNDERLGRDLLDDVRETLEVKDNTGRGINVGGSNQLVLLLGQSLLNLFERRTATNGTIELGDVGAILGQAVGETVTEETGAEDQDILTSLDKVGSNNVPAKSTGSVDDVWLSVGVGRLDELAQESQGLSEGVDEAGANVGLAVGGLC